MGSTRDTIGMIVLSAVVVLGALGVTLPSALVENPDKAAAMTWPLFVLYILLSITIATVIGSCDRDPHGDLD